MANPRQFNWLKSALFATGVLLSLGMPWSLAAQNPPSERQLERESIQRLKKASELRIALVIGNGAYQNSKLKNPSNDATSVAGALRELGFEVTSGANKSQREMKQMIREFGQRLRARGGVGIFYFAGHGVQAKGRNYLIPVDANVQTEADLEDQAVDVNYLLNLMDDAQNALNIVILDACRNNPFARSFRSAQGGLAQVKAPTGTLIAYATAPDSTSDDGGGSNSPYTEELTKQLRVPGVLVETMFRRVAEQVSARTGGKQEPWFSANVKGDFFFNLGARSDTANSNNASNTTTGPTSISEASREQALWDAVKDSNNPQDLKDYLAKYPNGAYVSAVQVKLRRVEAANNINTDPSSSNAVKNPGNSTAIADAASNNKNWQKLNPGGEEFSVLMPKDSLTESRRSLYNGSSLNRNVYRTQIGGRPFFAVISASGINARHSHPTEAEKLDAYVDALKYWLPEAALGKGPAARLTLVGENSLNGNASREYRVELGDLSGIARAYFTGRRFYVAVILDATQQDRERFFDGFVLPQRIP